jgi:PPIC-type PPIASE domain
MLKKTLTEPLLHFIVISILFFVAYEVLNPRDADNQVIVVSEGRVAQINKSFITRWNRTPLPTELESAIQGYAINEMYLREARALTLDVGDKVINRRLRQKIEFLLADTAANNEPTDEELKKFHQENPENYRSSTRYSFKQVLISIDRTEEGLSQSLQQQNQRIQQGMAPEGDNSLLPSEVTLADHEQLVGNFGETFANELERLELNKWQGPIKSAFGFHFVFLQDRTIATIKSFDSVQKSVLQDWQYENSQSYKKQYEQQLLERYKVTVQRPGPLKAQ